MSLPRVASLVSFVLPLLFAAGILMIEVPSAVSAAAPIKLNGALVAGGDVSGTGFTFSPDSSRVRQLVRAVCHQQDSKMPEIAEVIESLISFFAKA